MSEQFADVGRVNLCYETFGDPGDPALLLCKLWPKFIDAIAENAARAPEGVVASPA
jgi:hypothetical protein